MTDQEPPILSACDNVLIEKTEYALHTGKQLLLWWQNALRSGGLSFFSLIPDESPAVTMRGFFGHAEIDGRPTSAMGCLQTHRFRRRHDSDSVASGETLESFVNTRYLRDSKWIHPDGLPGGFGYEAMLYQCKPTARYHRIPDNSAERFPDLGQVGSRYEWVMFRVDIFDFVRCIPRLRPHVKRLSRLIREAAYVVTHEEFTHRAFPPVESVVVDQRQVGYSFVPAIVHPNVFGFGPGRFGTAIKLMQFSLLDKGDLEISMVFLCAPRSEKVLYLGGVDPVYGVIHLLDMLTLGKLKIEQNAHDRLDTVMMRQHGIVHQSMIEGLRSIWESQNWPAPVASTL